MIFLSTQEAISPMKTFLTEPLPYGAMILAISIIVTVVFCVVTLRSYYLYNIKALEEKARKMERGVADLEAKEAQVNGELDDLRKAEAILIHRNGVLENQVKEYTILCAQQEKRMETIESLFNKRS